MKQSVTLKGKLVQTLFSVLIVYTLAVVLGSVLLVQWSPARQFLLTSVIGLVTALLIWVPWTVAGMAVVSVAIYSYTARQHPERLLAWAAWIAQFTENISKHLSGIEAITYNNAQPFWLLLVFLICLYTGLALFRLKRPFLLLPLYVGCFIYYWYLYIDVAYPMLSFFLLLFFILYGAEKCSQTGLYPLWFRTSVGYALIIVTAASLLPKLEPVASWAWVEQQAQTHFPQVYQLRNDLIYSRSVGQGTLFDFSQTGFQSGDSRLGGPVTLGNQLIMEVKAPEPLYLRGNVKMLYEDSTWKQKEERERVYGIREMLPVVVNSGVPVTLEITYANMATQTIFSPYQAVSVRAQGVNRIYLKSDYQMTFNGAIFKGETYQVQAVLPSVENLDKADARWEEGLEAYLQLPPEISARVFELAREVTVGADTPLEKAQAIQNYLRREYSYSLTPSPLLPEQELVDTFLFEEGEGYCTYFATAMAVLLRAEGVPVRYVEGYLMPQEEKNGRYQVREENAHAWVEVYMGSAGWMTFEPTPAFEPPVFQEEEVARETTLGPVREQQENYESQIRAAFQGEDLEFLTGDFMPVNDQLPATGVSEETMNELWEKGRAALVLFLQIVLLGGIPAVLLYYLLLGAYTRLHLKRSHFTNQILHSYGNILLLLEQLGLPRLAGETAAEYTDRVHYRVYDGPSDLRQMTEIYLKAKYSPRPGTESELNALRAFEAWLRGRAKRRNGRFRHFYRWHLKPYWRNY